MVSLIVEKDSTHTLKFTFFFYKKVILFQELFATQL